MLPKVHQKIKQLVLCWIAYKLRLKDFQTFKAYQRFSNYKCSINWLWIRDLMKFKLLNTCLSSTKLITWIMAIFANFNVVKQDGNINVDPSHFNQRPINSTMRVQGNFGITFHGGLEHRFLHI
jgi:hypothetical protein